MILLRNIAKETQKSIIVSTHELDLALQTTDIIWLMQKNKGVSVGMPEDLVLNGLFQSIFKNKLFSFDELSGGFTINYTSNITVSLRGSEKYTYWTSRALKREGYKISEESDILIDIETNKWKVKYKNKEMFFNTIYELINGLKIIINKEIIL